MYKQNNSFASRLFFLIFVSIIFISPFPLGSNRSWAWSLEALVAVLLLVVLVVSSQLHWYKINWNRLKKIKKEISIIVLWLVINGVYLILIPIKFLLFLSPNVASSYAELGLNYGYLSLDVHASYFVLMLSIFYGALFLLGVVLINSRKRVKFMLFLFVTLGVIESIYGMYLVSIKQSGLFVHITSVSIEHASGTFVNKNHLVAFLSMSCLLGFGLRLIIAKDISDYSFEKTSIRMIRFIAHPLRLLDVSLIIIIAGIWNTHSRSGIMSFIISICFFYLFLFLLKKSKKLNYKHLLSFVSIVLLILILVSKDFIFILDSLGVNADNQLQLVMNSAEGRLMAFNQVLGNISKFWFSGVGPGAYQVFFVNFRSQEQMAYFDHAHNDYLEFLIEYGLLSVVIFGLFIYMIYKLVKFILRGNSRFYKYLGMAAICCIIYLLIHGNMDFNARIPANVITIIVVISMVYGKIIRSNVISNE